jgi:hypothetical protein
VECGDGMVQPMTTASRGAVKKTRSSDRPSVRGRNPTAVQGPVLAVAAVWATCVCALVDQQSLVDLLADRRDAVASARPFISSHGRRCATSTPRRSASSRPSIASAAAPPPTTLDDLDPDTPFNAVHCAHYEPAADGLPALHLTPTGLLADTMLHELLADTMLHELLTAPQVCLAVEDPHQECAPEHRAAGPHQHLRLHLNPATDYGHDDCIVASSCIGCMPRLFDDLTEHQAGWIRRCILSGHRWVGQARFRLVNTATSLAAVEAARERLTPA